MRILAMDLDDHPAGGVSPGHDPELDATRLYFGDELAKAETAAKVAATEKLHEIATVASRARRAAFNALEAGRENLFGRKDLLTALEGGMSLDEVDEAELPATVQALAPAERERYLAEQAEKRKELTGQLEALAQERDAYLADQAKTIEDVDDRVAGPGARGLAVAKSPASARSTPGITNVCWSCVAAIRLSGMRLRPEILAALTPGWTRAPTRVSICSSRSRWRRGSDPKH